MFTAEPTDVEGLRSPGGERFAAFVNDLIRAHARAIGIPDNAVHTDLQNVEDGGVDAEVTSGAVDASGLMTHPTTWQFKATDSGHVGPTLLENEIRKKYAQARVAQGFAFVVCICDRLSMPMRQSREDALRSAAAEINADAPPPMVLDANDLAVMATAYPAVVLHHFRPQLDSHALPLARWGDGATVDTPQYVDVSALDADRARIERHLDFSESPTDVVLLVRGEAGVGKSRLVFETLRGIPASAGLVLYTEDEESAVRLSYQLANGSFHAVLVCDECTSTAVARLRGLLRGHRDRVRVVALETTKDEYGPQKDGEAIVLAEIPGPTLDEILARNFPEVPQTRRRAYAHLAQGFVRFAVDLCRRDAGLDPRHPLDRMPFAIDYVRNTLTRDEQQAVAAIALLDAVGFQGEAAGELDRLCGFLGEDRKRLARAVTRIRDAPGFVATAGHYWHVMPPIVARVGFAEGWRMWATNDPGAFLERLADEPSLLSPFLRRVGESAAEEVRRVVSAHFRPWTCELDATSLTRPALVDRLVDLIEVDPTTYVPELWRLVKEAPREQLLNDTSVGKARRNVRHELVRIARRMALLPKCFHDSEAILLRLALAESEPKIGGNATETWRQLFKLILSGTTLSFTDRLVTLSERLRSADPDEAALAVSALVNVFDPHSSRGLDEPITAGRLQDEDWAPAGWDEQRACLDAALEVLQAVVTSGSVGTRELAWEAVLGRLHGFIWFGYASALQALFPPDLVPEQIRGRVVAEASWRLRDWDERDGRRTRRNRPEGTDANALRKLVAHLTPSDFHGRLVVAVTGDRWKLGAYHPNSPWRGELAALAQEALSVPENLAGELDWLCSNDATNGYEFGELLGKSDLAGTLLNAVLEQSRKFPSASFPLGYVKGLTEAMPAFSERINGFLDKIEVGEPLLAFYVAANGGDDVQALDRALRLVDQGAVPAVHLRVFEQGIKGRPLTNDEFERVLERLVSAAERGEVGANRVGLRIVDSRLGDDQRRVVDAGTFRRKQARDLAWQLLDHEDFDIYDESDSWGEVLKALAQIEPERGARTAARGLASIRYISESGATEVLQDLAKNQPDLVMAEIGRVMLDERLGYAFSLHPHRDVVEILPVAVVRHWLRQTGVSGAAAIAKHLPRPYLDAAGCGVVPELTDAVLGEFGDHKQVVMAFCRGSFQWVIAEEVQEAAEQRRALAEVAGTFSGHAAPWLREWARFAQQEAEDHSHIVADLDDEAAEFRFRRHSAPED